MISFGILLFNLILLIIDGAPSNPDNYLYKFGYLQPAILSRKDTGVPYNLEKSKEKAMRKFQAATGLEMTGRANEHTLNKMQQSTCGQPQPVEGARNPPTPWRGKVKYYIKEFWSGDPEDSKFTANVQRDLIKAAFDMYATSVPALAFQEVSSADEANITLEFAKQDHSDGHNFDGKSRPEKGEGQVLAHAFYPSDGRVHFDDAEFWMYMQENFESKRKKTSHTDFLTVAIHEIGHALGLAHILDNAASIMAPLYQSPILGNVYKPPKLDAAVIENLKGLYEQGKGIADNRIPEQMKTNRDCMEKVYAVFNLPDHRIAFVIDNGKRFTMFNSMSFQMVQNVNVSKLFTNGPSQVIAAYYSENNERIMLFSGNRIWAYDFNMTNNEVALANNYPKNLPNNWRANAAFVLNEHIVLVNKIYDMAYYIEDANRLEMMGHINKVFPNMHKDIAAFAEFNFGKKFGFTRTGLFKYNITEKRTEWIGKIDNYFNCFS